MTAVIDSLAPEPREPKTPTGKDDHDRAWAAADNGDLDGIAVHAGLREGCPACFGIAQVEDEAAKAERQRLAEPMLRAAYLIANYLWNEDGEDESWLEDAYQSLVSIVGPVPEDYVLDEPKEGEG